MDPLKNRKVAIVGLDGATWKIIQPLVDKGELPTFRIMMENGKWGNLRSTIPPVTAPAWSTMITGRNPGCHGLFDFTRHRTKEYKISYTYGGLRKIPGIWEYLNQLNYKAGFVNVPMTFPPEKIDGYMISGMDTPDTTSEFVFPGSLKTDIRENVGPLKLDIHHLGFMNTDPKRKMILDQLKEIEEDRFQLIRYLWNHYPVDVFMTVLNATDQVQHHFWHYMDSSHPRFDRKGHALFKDAIADVYKKMDTILARMLTLFGDSTLVMLVSDHGFQATSPIAFRINKALAEGGFLHFRPSGSRMSAWVSEVDHFLRKRLSPEFKTRVNSLLPGVRSKMESLALDALIDWKKTKAYCFELSLTSPNVWINTVGHRPGGIVDAFQYQQVREEVRDWLLSYRDPLTREPVIPRIYTKEEVYSGPEIKDAPDLIPAWWEGRGFVSCSSLAKGRVSHRPVIENLADPIEGGKEWSGTHDINGIVLLYGPGVEPGTLENAAIEDIAPTVFAALNESCDGLFEGKSLIDTHPAPTHSRVFQPSAATCGKTEITMSDEDQEKIENRLKALGYIDE
jgi:predicted AlkP superfamily phosphohydrolase/phosphomutase